MSLSSAATLVAASPCAVDSPPAIEPSPTTGAAEHHEPAAPAAVGTSFVNDIGSLSSHSQSSSQTIDFTINSEFADAATMTHPTVVDLTSTSDQEELPVTIDLSSPEKVRHLLLANTPKQLANTLECETGDNFLLPPVDTTNLYDDWEMEQFEERPSYPT